MRDSNLNWAERFALDVIKCGKIPRHVAFIMDGNRRYAKKFHLNSSTDGHVHGFDKLAQALQWCLDIGIEEVTVYAFSIENFNRSESEVNALLELAREKFYKFMDEKDELNKRGICIRMIGNWKLLPLDLQKCMADVMLLTQNNNKAFLNVAFAYTSRDEITESIRDIVNGVKHNELEPNDVTDRLIRRCMYSGRSSDPDLLVRTSGESRLSDFLLWQVIHSLSFYAYGVLISLCILSIFFWDLFLYLGVNIHHIFYKNTLAGIHILASISWCLLLSATLQNHE